MMDKLITNPKGNVAVAQEICRFIAQRKDYLMASADAIKVTAENWNDPQTKSAIKELEESVEDLRERGKRLVVEALAATEAQRVVTAIDKRLWTYSMKSDPASAYCQLSAKLKELKAQVSEFKKALMPQPKPRAWVVSFQATDDQFNAIAKAATKAGAPFEYFAVPQTDKAVKDICKWFNENQ